MFYLIGVAHRVQSKQKEAGLSADQKQFLGCLEEAIKELKPLLIGEEFSEFALKKLSKETHAEHESVTQPLAKSYGVEYRACDPDETAREKMGYVEGTQIALDIAMSDNGGLSNAEINDRGFAIEVAKHWPRREAFWLDQIRDVVNKDVIFICGDAHIETFRELLKRNGIDSNVLDRGIGVTQQDHEFWVRVMRYLEAHPELYH